MLKRRKTSGVAGIWLDDHELVIAAAKVREAGYKKFDAITPFPVHGLEEAIGIPRSWIPWVTLKDASSPGVIYFSDTSQSADNVGIYNNTFYRVSRNTIYFGSTSKNNTVKNHP